MGFCHYRNLYPNLAMARDDDGILIVTLHSNGETLLYDASVKHQLIDAFHHVGADRDNEVVILTGAGDSFIGYRSPLSSARSHKDGEVWDRVYWNTKHALHGLLDIEVPVISAVNGPATVHAEYAVLSDVVLACDTAVFRDTHFTRGLVPGDGSHVVWRMLLGLNRGRYFLLTGQTIDAYHAMELGFVHEVLPRERLLDRAKAMAREILRQPRLTRRYTRVCFTQPIKAALLRELGYGLQLEGMSEITHQPY